MVPLSGRTSLRKVLNHCVIHNQDGKPTGLLRDDSIHWRSRIATNMLPFGCFVEKYSFLLNQKSSGYPVKLEKRKVWPNTRGDLTTLLRAELASTVCLQDECRVRSINSKKSSFWVDYSCCTIEFGVRSFHNWVQYLPIRGCAGAPRLHWIVVIRSETTAARRSRSRSVIPRSSIAQPISWIFLQRRLILSIPFFGLLFFSQNSRLFGAFVGNFLLAFPSFSHFFSTIAILLCFWFCGRRRQGISLGRPAVGIWRKKVVTTRIFESENEITLAQHGHGSTIWWL